uniref:PBPe domain-containing protein n=1 Tax=Meloidogyne hapla TaxID=6305 RepID=A0A1I8BYC2_MELHA
MADMEWPEGKANPPQGTPDKFHIKVVTLHEPPFVVVTELDPETGQCPGSQGTPCDWGFENNTLWKCCTGYCVDLLNKLAKDIGFSYTLYKVRDEKWGIKTTANLAAFMITRVQYYQLVGVDDEKLNFPELQNPPFRFGTVEGGNTHETMRRNWHRMHSYVEQNQFYRDNISAGVESVRRGELDAFIYDAVVLDHQAGKDPNCGLMTVGKWASMTGYGIGFPKNSPLVSRVNHFMLQYQQRGDLERLQNFWLTGACSPESNTQGSGSSPLGVENFLSAFFLLAVGIAMAKSLSFTEAVDRVQEWRRRWGRQEQSEEQDVIEEDKVVVLHQK